MVFRSVSEYLLMSQHHHQHQIHVLCPLHVDVSLIERVWSGFEGDSLT